MSLKNKVTSGVLTTRHWTCQPRKITAADNRNIVKISKNITSNLHRAGVKISQSTIQRKLWQQKYKSHSTRHKLLISSKNQKARREFTKKYNNVPLGCCTRSKGKSKVCKKKWSAHYPKYVSSFVKHGAWHGLGLRGCFWNRPTNLIMM